MVIRVRPQPSTKSFAKFFSVAHIANGGKGLGPRVHDFGIHFLSTPWLQYRTTKFTAVNIYAHLLMTSEALMASKLLKFFGGEYRW